MIRALRSSKAGSCVCGERVIREVMVGITFLLIKHKKNKLTAVVSPFQVPQS